MAGRAIAFLCGLVFAAGLAIAQMTNPNKVLAFLDITGDWDPSLAFVMAGAIAVYATVYRVVQSRSRAAKPDPGNTKIDLRLVVGGALFGLGWGLVGYCPGPALVALPTLTPAVLITAGGMIAGMLAFRAWNARAN